MLFPVNLLNEEQVRTSPPAFLLPALGFLFSELVSDMPLPSRSLDGLHTEQHSAQSSGS